MSSRRRRQVSDSRSAGETSKDEEVEHISKARAGEDDGVSSEAHQELRMEPRLDNSRSQNKRNRKPPSQDRHRRKPQSDPLLEPRGKFFQHDNRMHSSEVSLEPEKESHNDLNNRDSNAESPIVSSSHQETRERVRPQKSRNHPSTNHQFKINTAWAHDKFEEEVPSNGPKEREKGDQRPSHSSEQSKKVPKYKDTKSRDPRSRSSPSSEKVDEPLKSSESSHRESVRSKHGNELSKSSELSHREFVESRDHNDSLRTSESSHHESVKSRDRKELSNTSESSHREAVKSRNRNESQKPSVSSSHRVSVNSHHRNESSNASELSHNESSKSRDRNESLKSSESSHRESIKSQHRNESLKPSESSHREANLGLRASLPRNKNGRSRTQLHGNQTSHEGSINGGDLRSFCASSNVLATVPSYASVTTNPSASSVPQMDLSNNKGDVTSDIVLIENSKNVDVMTEPSTVAASIPPPSMVPTSSLSDSADDSSLSLASNQASSTSSVPLNPTAPSVVFYPANAYSPWNPYQQSNSFSPSPFPMTAQYLPLNVPTLPLHMNSSNIPISTPPSSPSPLTSSSTPSSGPAGYPMRPPMMPANATSTTSPSTYYTPSKSRNSWRGSNNYQHSNSHSPAANLSESPLSSSSYAPSTSVSASPSVSPSVSASPSLSANTLPVSASSAATAAAAAAASSQAPTPMSYYGYPVVDSSGLWIQPLSYPFPHSHPHIMTHHSNSVPPPLPLPLPLPLPPTSSPSYVYAPRDQSHASNQASSLPPSLHHASMASGYQPQSQQ